MELRTKIIKALNIDCCRSCMNHIITNHISILPIFLNIFLILTQLFFNRFALHKFLSVLAGKIVEDKLDNHKEIIKTLKFSIPSCIIIILFLT